MFKRYLVAIIAALGLAFGSIVAGTVASPARAAESDPGPIWVAPHNGAKVSAYDMQIKGLTLTVRPNPADSAKYVKGDAYLFGLFKVNSDGSRTALYENYANEHHLNGTTWTLARDGAGVKALLGPKRPYTLELWVRAWLVGNHWTHQNTVRVTVTNEEASPLWNGGVKETGATKVGATWTVPKLDCKNSASYSQAPQWVGLGGFTDGNLVQVGIASRCQWLPAGKSYQINYPVWQILPEFKISQVIYSKAFSVRTGDVIDASVTKNRSTSEYYLSLRDRTQNWTWTAWKTQKATAATPTSADWIVERIEQLGGYADLAPFGTVKFTRCYYADASGLHNLKVDDTLTKVLTAGSTGLPLTSVSGQGNTISVKYLRPN